MVPREYSVALGGALSAETQADSNIDAYQHSLQSSEERARERGERKKKWEGRKGPGVEKKKTSISANINKRYI